MAAPPPPADATAACLQQRVTELEALLATAMSQRAAERAARIRLQRAQRSLPPEVVPLGVLRSCFSRRCGTPRQPGLVPAARAVLTLRPGVPACALDGLAEHSHVWLLYLFHQNTNLHGGAGVRARVAVPRLGGALRGVLATRSPHRPSSPPVGLSLVRLLRVDGASLWLGGADCVDGTPVLDVKPYSPFADAPPPGEPLRSPPWVAAATDDEPLRMAGVQFAPGAEGALWAAHSDARRAQQQHQRAQQVAQAPPLYDCAADFARLVAQVLSLDVRSLRERGAPTLATYRCTLCGVEVEYAVGGGGQDDRAVTVLGGRAALLEEAWEAAQDAGAEAAEPLPPAES